LAKQNRHFNLRQFVKDASAIAFDFDGVIVESVGIKDQAFSSLFCQYTVHYDQIMSYHLSHNATVRFEKFEYIFENILGLSYSDDIEAKLNTQFSEFVFNRIVSCPIVPGVLGFLNVFSGNKKLYLISMTPEAELIKILKSRGLLDFFKLVYSSVWKKVDAIRDIMSTGNMEPGELVFIGDSPEDWHAAKETGIRFVGRKTEKLLSDVEYPLITDFLE
jgi:phosphoglycolate phosphatase-like HAD superfamily hydrolase